MGSAFENVFATTFRRRSAIIFWLLAISVAAYWSYSEQEAYLSTCNIVEGKVVDELWLRVGRSDEWCPQVSYYVNGQEYFFADKSTSADVGETVKVIYEKNNLRNAQIYTVMFWINFRVIILTWLIAFVVFGLLWGLTQKFPATTEVLPSNRIF